MNAYLILENGTIFSGETAAAFPDRICEVVSNTAMAGFTEILTDPRGAGQALCFSYPLIGNSGVCFEDFMSDRPQISALIVSECSEFPSNFRCETSLQAVLERYEIPMITGIDTRSLVRLLRDRGAQRGLLTARPERAARPKDTAVEIAAYRPAISLPSTVREGKVFGPEGGKTVALLDMGARQSLIEALTGRGLRVTVCASDWDAGRILADKPGALLLSEGPGDPNDYPALVKTVKALAASPLPLMALGLGHQLLALAHGARVIRLPHGHRGTNHPVRNLQTSKVTVTAQNHGYAAEEKNLDKGICRVSHENVNDGTVEGIQYHTRRNTVSLQFTPDASEIDAYNAFWAGMED